MNVGLLRKQKFMKKLKTTFSAFETEQPQIEILKYNEKMQ